MQLRLGLQLRTFLQNGRLKIQLLLLLKAINIEVVRGALWPRAQAIAAMMWCDHAPRTLRLHYCLRPDVYSCITAATLECFGRRSRAGIETLNRALCFVSSEQQRVGSLRCLQCKGGCRFPVIPSKLPTQACAPGDIVQTRPVSEIKFRPTARSAAFTCAVLILVDTVKLRQAYHIM